MPSDLLVLALAEMQFLTCREKIFLQNKLDNIAELAVLSIDDISVIVGRKIRSSWWNGKDCLLRAERNVRLLEAFGIQYTLYSDENYPSLVSEIYDPPFVLFYRGDMNVVRDACICVVGTRKPSTKAIEATFSFAKDASGAGFTVISGLAFGIDAAAHKGALAGNGKTLAVLPCGLDGVAPVSHKFLAQAILERGGCLMSEYVPCTEAAKFRFPQRNRIIAALSPVTLIAEAPKNSGALITADFALEQGRDVYLHQAGFENPLCAQGMGLYKDDGAPVISSFEDFMNYRNVAPGTVYCKQDKQLYL